MTKFRTIWHYAIAFFEEYNDMFYYSINNIDGEPYYEGLISDLTYDIAKHIAPFDII